MDAAVGTPPPRDLEDEFLTSISHEIRSPLTAVVGYAETLEHRIDDLDRASIRMSLSALVTSAHRLQAVIEDLLDFDRLRRGSSVVCARPTRIEGLVKMVATECDRLGARDVVFHLAPAIASVDAAKIERSVDALLCNVATHTPGDARVEISTRSEGSCVRIEVADDGPGVPPEMREDIFEPFRHGPDGIGAEPGLGMGLSMVREVARRHGGDAWVEPSSLGGSCFVIRLPA